VRIDSLIRMRRSTLKPGLRVWSKQGKLVASAVKFHVERGNNLTRFMKIVFVAAIAASLLYSNPAVAQGSLDGLYLMTRMSGSSLETATYLFHNGTLVKNPISSSGTPNLDAERAIHPNDVGTYKFQGGQLTFTFPNGNRQARFETMNGGFGWDAGIFSPVEIFKPGATLNGTFSGGNSVGGGALMASSDITFHPDGTYQSGLVTSFDSKGRTSEVSGGSQHSEHGKYRIVGTALHMTPDGGKESVFSTFPWDDGTSGPAPRALYFSGIMMTRTK
jgi:hypothetical protein